MSHSVWIALGSNMGDRLGWLRYALARLREKDLILKRCSSVYETEPWGVESQTNYYNAVTLWETELQPLQVLELCQQIEADTGRRREYRWAPRQLDLDLLLWDDEIIDHPRLSIPHPLMSCRRFVLEPLLEAGGNIAIPGRGFTADLLEQLPPEECRRLQNEAEWYRFALDPIPGSAEKSICSKERP